MQEWEKDARGRYTPTISEKEKIKLARTSQHILQDKKRKFGTNQFFTYKYTPAL